MQAPPWYSSSQASAPSRLEDRPLTGQSPSMTPMPPGKQLSKSTSRNRVWWVEGGYQPLPIQKQPAQAKQPHLQALPLWAWRPFHFIAMQVPCPLTCPILSLEQYPCWNSTTPSWPGHWPSAIHRGHDRSGTDKDAPTQTFTINFLTQLKNHCNLLIFQQWPLWKFQYSQ